MSYNVVQSYKYRGVFMFKKLEEVEKRYEELNELIADPAIIAKQNEWKKLMKEHSDITPVVEKYREYKSAKQSEEELKEMLNDKEMHDLAQDELNTLKDRIPQIEEELKILLVPKDLFQHIYPPFHCSCSPFTSSRLISETESSTVLSSPLMISLLPHHLALTASSSSGSKYFT